MKKLILVCSFLFIALPAFAENDAIWQHVLDKQTLRCGYITYEPGFIKDVNTDTFSGYDKDVIEAVAKRLELKIKWVPASGWGTFVDDMKTNKFDMLCNLTWTNAKHAKHALYSQPAFYQPLFFIARSDDKRFDNNPALIDRPETHVAVLESDIPYYVLQTDHPKTSLHTLPPNFEFSLVYNEVVAKKADLTISAASDLGFYLKNNPGKLRLLYPDHPVRVFPSSFVMPTGETQMKQAIDQALNEIILSGEIKTIFAKYNKYPHSFYYPTISYEAK